MRYRKLYTILVCAGSIAIATVCIVFLFVSYESLIKIALSISGKPYLETILRQKIFTQNKYALLRKMCCAMLIAIPIFIVLLLKYRSAIFRYLYFVATSIKVVWKNVKNVFRQNTKAQNITIIVSLVIIAAKALYYIIQYDLQYDEMWSYNYFTAQPIYYSFVVSSNYPLYEIVTGLFKYLPFNMKVNIRLPVLIAGLFSCVILYACLRAYFKNHLAAFGALIVFAFMPLSTFYMLYARGVMLALLFAIISIFSIFFWVKQKENTAYLVVYALSCAAGVYAMPTNIYLCALLFLLAIFSCVAGSKKYIKNIIAANAAAAFLSLLFYLPVIAGSGISFLYDAATDVVSARPSWNDFATYHSSASFFFTGFTAGFFVFIAAAFGLFLYNKSTNKIQIFLIISLCLYVLPATIYFFQNVQLPMRSLAFVGLIIPLLFSAIVFLLSKRIARPVLFSFILISGVCAAFISHKHSYLNWSRQQDKEAKMLANLFMQHGIVTCYDNSKGSDFFYDYPALEYYYRIQNKPFTLTINDTNSLRYKPFFIGDKYDCIISKIDDSLPAKNYLELYKNADENFKVLLRK